jgi:hypothetical protein
MATNTRNLWGKYSIIDFLILKSHNRDTVRDLISKLRETGSVEDAARRERSSVLTEKLGDIFMADYCKVLENRSENWRNKRYWATARLRKLLRRSCSCFLTKCQLYSNWNTQIIYQKRLYYSERFANFFLKTEKTFWMWRSTPMKLGSTSQATLIRTTCACGFHKTFEQLLKSLYIKK